MQPSAWEALRPTVVIAGAGIWTEVLARLVFRSGGSAIVVARPEDLYGVSRPACVVIGAPLSPSELVRATVMVRDRSPLTPVIAALDGCTPPELAADLGILGAAAIPLDADAHRVANWVARYAGLNIRVSHRGILMAPVLLRSGTVLHAAIASDVSEGGLGVECVEAALASAVEEAQFHLPGIASPLTVATEVAWIEATDRARVRLGLRFVGLDGIDLGAIRAYLGSDDDAERLAAG